MATVIQFPHRAFVALFLGITIFLLHPAIGLAVEDHPDGVVAHCFDGDTLKLMDRRVVRLAGIDAPEVPHGGKPAQYYARQSRQILESMCKGRRVRLALPGIKNRDQHGRLIADAFLDDGTSVTESLVERGAAFFYPHKDLGPEYQERLRELQADAIHERRGLWDHLLSLPLAREHYIGNRASLRFFPADCPEAMRIKPRNRVNFGTLMDAFLAGYAPARICVFWPDERDSDRNLNSRNQDLQ